MLMIWVTWMLLLTLFFCHFNTCKTDLLLNDTQTGFCISTFVQECNVLILLKLCGKVTCTSVCLMIILQNVSQGGSVGNLFFRTERSGSDALLNIWAQQLITPCAVPSKLGIQVIQITPVLTLAGFYSHIRYASKVTFFHFRYIR